MSGLSDKMLRRLIWLLLVLALVFLGTAFYIPAKAKLAQVLLHQAWANTLLHHGQVNKPWPWADTWPVARLLVPSQDIDQIVLHGDRGNSLAFGPGLSLQSFQHRGHSVIMISAHRDTEFHFLKHVAVGEAFFLQNTHAQYQRYLVKQIQIIDSRNGNIRVPDRGKWLILVTCYPFDALLTGGSRRYVVTARAIGTASNTLYSL